MIAYPALVCRIMLKPPLVHILFRAVVADIRELRTMLCSDASAFICVYLRLIYYGNLRIMLIQPRLQIHIVLSKYPIYFTPLISGFSFRFSGESAAKFQVDFQQLILYGNRAWRYLRQTQRTDNNYGQGQGKYRRNKELKGVKKAILSWCPVKAELSIEI